MAEQNEQFKTCDMCKFSSNTTSDVLVLGDWMEHQGITVHYFCLLLSTHLPQNGKDAVGILGFLLRDIRKEMDGSSRRACCYCQKKHASVGCYSCKDYFHVKCGYYSDAVFYFMDDFRSYCDRCVPLTETQLKHAQLPAETQNRQCTICRDNMGFYQPVKWIFGECCGNGFVHMLCMRKYALRAGYYLKCIWCKDVRFREYVRKQSVFVPDRDAVWELERCAYRDLHRGHERCDMQECLCPRGRECHWGKWTIIKCALCGSFGAHNPFCIKGDIKAKELITEFKCDTCKVIEKSKRQNSPNSAAPNIKNMNITLYTAKTIQVENDLSLHDTPSFSAGETQSQLCLTDNTQVTFSEGTLLAVNQISNKQPHSALILKNTALEQRDIIDLCSQNLEDEQNTTPIELTENEDIINAILGEVRANGILQNSENFPTTPDITGNFVTFDAFNFNSHESKCLGRCKIRIDLTKPRFMDKTIEEIQHMPGLLTYADVVAYVSNTGLFAEIDQILAKYN